MTNSVLLKGYITNKPHTSISSDERKRTTFTLNVQRDHDSENGVSSNAYDYIPVIIYGSDKKSGLPNDYHARIIKVQGRLTTYPDYYGKIRWGILASSVTVDGPIDPFATQD